MGGFARRISSRIASQKPRINVIRTVSLKKAGRFIGAATNKSKRKRVLKAKPMRNVSMMANFLTESIKCIIKSFPRASYSQTRFYIFLTPPQGLSGQIRKILIANFIMLKP
jgi:hypothetical protein